MSRVLDPSQISWDYSNKRDLAQGADSSFDPVSIRTGTYRPFTREFVYFNRTWNNRVYRLPQIFPTVEHPNHGFYYVGAGSAVPFSVLMIDSIPDLHVTGAGSGGQFFSRFTYEKVEDDDALFHAAEGEIVDGYRRIDNITDGALGRFHTAYGPSITKDDIFSYVYGLLHCPGYRTQFAADLKKMLPRIPMVTDPLPFIQAGRALSELHVGYESAKPYPLEGLPDGAVDSNDEAEFQHFQVEKMRFGKPTAEQTRAGLRNDRSTVLYNDHITLRGVPEEAYMLGSRSANECIMARYQVKVDKDSQIKNDPNDWSLEVGNPRYIIDLLARIVTVSLETMAIVDALPKLDVLPTPKHA
jgi:predicted helicase